MRCSNCGKDFDTAGDCPYCGAVPEINTQVLMEEERNSFSGITIDEGGNDFSKGSDDYQKSYQQQTRNSGVYVKNISLGSGLISQLVAILLLAVAIFVLLPAFLVGFLIIAVIWFVIRLFR